MGGYVFLCRGVLVWGRCGVGFVQVWGFFWHGGVLVCVCGVGGVGLLVWGFVLGWECVLVGVCVWGGGGGGWLSSPGVGVCSDVEVPACTGLSKIKKPVVCDHRA